MKNPQYNIVTIDNEYWIELLEDPFKGVRYKYGKVEFIEPETEGGDAICKFDFDIWDQRLVIQLSEDKLFQSMIGDILIGLIEKQLADNEVVYTGGV